MSINPTAQADAKATDTTLPAGSKAELKSAKGDIKEAGNSAANAAKKTGNVAVRFAKDSYAKLPAVKVPGNPFTAQGRTELKSAPREVANRLGTERNYASNRGIVGCLVGAATCVAGFTGLVYKDLAIELFKGILLHDALLVAAIVLTTLAVVQGAIRLFNATTARPVAAGVSATVPGSADLSLDDQIAAKEAAIFTAKNAAKENVDLLASLNDEVVALNAQKAQAEAAAATNALANAAAKSEEEANAAKGEAAVAKGETEVVKGKNEALQGALASKEATIEEVQDEANQSAQVAAKAKAEAATKQANLDKADEASRLAAEASKLAGQVSNDNTETKVGVESKASVG